MSDLFEVSPDLDRWLDDNCIITAADRMEGEVLHYEVVEQKLVELATQQMKLKTALSLLREGAQINDLKMPVTMKLVDEALGGENGHETG